VSGLISKDYKGRVVLITGGTKGIGLACGLAFGRLGAHVWLTHRWGSADEDAIRAEFARAGAPEPRIVEADASKTAETKNLMALIAEHHEGVDVFICYGCVVM
jgi:NAD(P)-dependent dehydrogenase (short-subunit alcohol dehydrogenase family)